MRLQLLAVCLVAACAVLAHVAGAAPTADSGSETDSAIGTAVTAPDAAAGGDSNNSGGETPNSSIAPAQQAHDRGTADVAGDEAPLLDAGAVNGTEDVNATAIDNAAGAGSGATDAASVDKASTSGSGGSSSGSVVEVQPAEPDAPKSLIGRGSPAQTDGVPVSRTPTSSGASPSSPHRPSGASSGGGRDKATSSSSYGEPSLRGSAAYTERSPTLVTAVEIDGALDLTSVLAGVFMALMALMFVRRCRASVVFSRGLVSVSGSGKSSPAVASQSQSQSSQAPSQSSDVRELIKVESEIRLPKMLNSGADRRSLLSDDHVRKIMRFIPQRYAAVRSLACQPTLSHTVVGRCVFRGERGRCQWLARGLRLPFAEHVVAWGNARGKNIARVRGRGHVAVAVHCPRVCVHVHM